MLSSELFLGLDVGTTAVKASCLGVDGIVQEQVRTEYPTAFGPGGRVTQKPVDWWDAAKQCLQQLSADRRARITGIAVSSHAPTLLGVAEDGTPLMDARIWADRTAAEESRALEALWGQSRIEALVGNRMDPYFLAPKLAQLRAERGNDLGAIPLFVQANGWLVHRLCGVWSIDDTHAALTQLYAADSGDWDDGVLQDLGVHRGQLPPLFSPSATVGHLTKAAAGELGLTAGIPVHAGSIDGSTSALGAGLTEAGRLYEMSGQSSGIGVITDDVIPHRRLVNLKHAIDGRWILKGSMSATGGSLRWLRDVVGAGATDAEDFAEFTRLAADADPGSGGVLFLPYILGERAPIWDPDARGVWFGLNATTSRADLVRSVMEGAAFGLRSVLGELEGIDHDPLIHGSGGGYLSQEWTQIKADVLGLPISVSWEQSDTASRGAALLALAGAGIPLPHDDDAPGQELVRPEDSLADLYDELFKEFVSLTSASASHFASLAAVRRRHRI